MAAEEEVVYLDPLLPRNDIEQMYFARQDRDDQVRPFNWIDPPRFANPGMLCQALKNILQDGDEDNEPQCPYPYDMAMELINSHLLLCQGRVYFKYRNLELGTLTDSGTLLREYYDALWDNVRRGQNPGTPGFVDWLSFHVREIPNRFPDQPMVMPCSDEEAAQMDKPPRKIGIISFWLKSLCKLQTNQVFHYFVDRARWDIRQLPVIRQVRMTSESYSEWRGFRHWHHFEDLAAQKRKYGNTPEEIYARHPKLRQLFNHAYFVLCSSHQPSCWALFCTLAQILQRPGDKTERIIQMPGPQGAGKSMMLYAIIVMLMGPGAGAWITRPEELFGQFNEGSVGNSPRLIGMDEFSCPGSKIEAACNNYVSAVTVQVNGKFKDPRNVYGHSTMWTITNKILSLDVRGRARRHLVCRVVDLIGKYLDRLQAKAYFDHMVREVLTQDTFFALATLLELLDLSYWDNNHRTMDLSNVASSEARIDGWRHGADPEDAIYMYLLDCIKSETINEATKNRAIVPNNLHGHDTPPGTPEPFIGPQPDPWLGRRVTSQELYKYATDHGGLDGNRVKHVDFRRVVGRTLRLKESRSNDNHVYYTLPSLWAAKLSFKEETGVDIDDLQRDELRASQAGVALAPPIPMDWAVEPTVQNSVKLRDIFVNEANL